MKECCCLIQSGHSYNQYTFDLKAKDLWAISVWVYDFDRWNCSINLFNNFVGRKNNYNKGQGKKKKYW